MGGFFQKPAAMFPSIKFYGMSLLSAGSISFDSTFKRFQPVMLVDEMMDELF
jgi:hypothetical protein